jgi:hypothetical protein
MSQFWTSERATTFLSLKTFPRSSYFTFASGGYIIMMRPIAMGIEVAPIERPFTNSPTEGAR